MIRRILFSELSSQAGNFTGCLEKKNMKTKLDSFERQIEKTAEEFQPVSSEKLRDIEKIITKAQKSKNVNIRISENVLEALKRRALLEGIPYQTLISSILHKYVT